MYRLAHSLETSMNDSCGCKSHSPLFYTIQSISIQKKIEVNLRYKLRSTQKKRTQILSIHHRRKFGKINFNLMWKSFAPAVRHALNFCLFLTFWKAHSHTSDPMKVPTETRMEYRMAPVIEYRWMISVNPLTKSRIVPFGHILYSTYSYSRDKGIMET